MARKRKPCPPWLATFADLMSLLMALFVLLFAMSSVDEARYQALVESLSLSFSQEPDLTQQQMDYLESLKQENERLKKEKTVIQDLRPLYESLVETYAHHMHERDMFINYDPKKNQIKVSFAESIAFPSGSARLKSGLIIQLRKLKILMEPDLKLTVVGHTDSVPIANSVYSSNWSLSSARAASVIERILYEGIAQPHQVEAIGLADTQPIADQTTEAGRAQNRRVEIILYPLNQSNEVQLSDEAN